MAGFTSRGIAIRTVIQSPLGCKVPRVAVGAGVASHAGKRGRNMVCGLALDHRGAQRGIPGGKVAGFTSRGIAVI